MGRWAVPLFLLLFGAPLQAAEPLPAKLTVEIRGIDAQAGGLLRIGLFRGERGWPKLKNAAVLKQLPATADNLSFSFEALPSADDYAIEIHHDENRNGQFDMRWFPYPRPKEGVGVSNNSFGFGHPKFDSARFTLRAPETTIQIRMRY